MTNIEVPQEILEKMLLQVRDLEKQIMSLLRGNETVEAELAEIRYYGPLAEVFNKGMHVSSQEMSELMKKYGRDLDDATGYFCGSRPNMKRVGDDQQQLTSQGKNIVLEARNAFGYDWLDRLPLEIIGDPTNLDKTKISF